MSVFRRSPLQYRQLVAVGLHPYYFIERAARPARDTPVSFPPTDVALRAVYFADEAQVDNASGAVTPTELMNVAVDQAAGTASFLIHHFSGYMFATGSENDGTITDGPGAQPRGAASMSLRSGNSAGVKLTGVSRAGRSARSMK